MVERYIHHFSLQQLNKRIASYTFIGVLLTIGSSKLGAYVMNEGQSEYLKPGTKVELKNAPEEGGSEFGIVVHCWKDTDTKLFDCYVAFFGNEFPVGTPNNKPYILRYAATSLSPIPDINKKNN